MTLQGIGANGSNDYIPQNSNKDLKLDSESTIWAKFNDNNNIVDISDVQYVENNNELRSSEEIKSFLEANKGKTWTNVLKNESFQLIERFNLECEGDALMDELDDPQKAFNQFKNGIKEDFKSFVEDENGKMIDFVAKNRREKNEFVAESVNKVLEDLKSGYKGYVSLSKIGVIQYDSEKNCFILKRDNGQTATLDDDKLAKIINIAVEHSVGIHGQSRKESVE